MLLIKFQTFLTTKGSLSVQETIDWYASQEGRISAHCDILLWGNSNFSAYHYLIIAQFDL
jgi:hypothetical protein